MAKQLSVAGQAQQLCAPLIEELGRIAGDGFVKENGERHSRFIIDQRGGIRMDDCETCSRAIEPLIDERLTINGSYHLSLHPIDRPLKSKRDLLRYLDAEVEVSLYKAREGVKKFTGVIEDVSDDETLVLRTADGKALYFTKAERASVKRVIRF